MKNTVFGLFLGWLLNASISLASLSEGSEHEDKIWTYAKQDTSWAEYKATCSGKFQSPINLRENETVRPDEGEVDDVRAYSILQHLSTKPLKIRINNPTSAKVRSLRFTLKTPLIYGTVKCHHVHFHIGQSEHAIDSKKFYGEIHIYCYHNRYEQIRNAVIYNKKDGLAAISILLEINNDNKTDNRHIKNMISMINNNPTGTGLTYKSLQFPNFLKNMDDDGVFYRYFGGLTVPGCNEIVKWSVFRMPFKISQNQADLLSALQNGWMKTQESGGWSELNDLNKTNLEPVANARKLQVKGDRLVILCDKDNCTPISSGLGKVELVLIGIGSAMALMIAFSIAVYLHKKSEDADEDGDNEALTF